MNLYDPTLAVQTYGHGLDQGLQQQEQLAQTPNPASVFLDRLRQAKQDQLQRDQFDWQKQYQGGVLQNTAERNQITAENNKLKGMLTNQGQMIRMNLGQEANRLRGVQMQLKEEHQRTVDPARKALLEEQARKAGLQADQLDQLTQMPDDGSGSIYQRMQEASIAAKEGIPELQQSQIWRNYNPPQMQAVGFGGASIPRAALDAISRHAVELQKRDEAAAKAWEANPMNKIASIEAQKKGGAAPQNPYRKDVNYFELAAQDLGYPGVKSQMAPIDVAAPGSSSGARVKAVSKGVPAPKQEAKRAAPVADKDGIVTIKDDSEYEGLASGTKYKGPDGVVRIK